MATKTLNQTVSCKHCGSTVMVQKQNTYDDESTTGGITSSLCRKCNKTSSYVYTIRNGEFVDLH